MSTPAAVQSSRALPDYLPARMINEFVYCPRLFYYEQVQGVFVESADTIEGSIEHRRVDKEGGEAPSPTSVSEEPVIARSITLSSERHKVIAKLDLAEFADGKRPCRSITSMGGPLRLRMDINLGHPSASSWQFRPSSCVPTDIVVMKESFTTPNRGNVYGWCSMSR